MNLKERLNNGERVFGTMVRCQRNPAYCIIAKDAGMDFILFDCEHGIYSRETLHDLFQMAHAVGLTAMLRVPMLDRESISRYLDSGAKGCMVPMTETAEQAREIVRWSKYPPVGERGYGSSIGACYYQTGLKSGDVMARINGEVLTIAQIESGLGADNVEEIVSTEGIDAVIIGPNDLSISLGVPGEFTSEKVVSAIRKVADACRRHGKAFGIHGPEVLQEMFADDINLCMHTTDVDLLRSAMSDLKQKMIHFRKNG